MIPAILVCCGIAYNLLAIVAALRFRRRRTIPDYRPPVSILKPVRGRDPRFYEAIRSHAMQQYPDFELIFGALPDDPAREDIERLKAEFPGIPIRVFDATNDAPNGKVGALEILAPQARHDILLVNDADILVEPDYLARVVSLLADEQAGMVTCLYRAAASSIASRAEALGIATEFAPSVLVARLLSSSGFALGATMAFRSSDLAVMGGFASIRRFLADDYQLGARIALSGKRVVLSDAIVETNLGAGTWRDVWKHQVRWARTIRISRPAGYLGYLVTQATFWCIVLAGNGWRWRLALAGFAVRLMAAACSLKVLGEPRWPGIIAVPFRDLFGVAVWYAGLWGHEVEWRGIRFRLLPGGRITPARP